MGMDVGAGGGSTGVVASFFCLLVLTDDIGGGVRFWGFDFVCEAPAHKKSNPSCGTYIGYRIPKTQKHGFLPPPDNRD